MIKTFVVPERRRNVPTSIHFHENIVPVPVSITTDEPIAPAVEIETNQFENPYKILRANLALTGSLDTSKSKKESAGQAKNNVPSLTVHQNELITSADKVSQIPIPMKIKSIIKKPMMENESRTHLRISASTVNDPLSEPSDASSYMHLKNVSSSEAVLLSDSKPSSVKSKHSEIPLDSPQSKRSDEFRNGNASEQKSNLEHMTAATNGSTVLTVTAAKQRNNDKETEMSSLFKRIDINNPSMHSSSSERSEKRNISTGQKSTSSDDFWK